MSYSPFNPLRWAVAVLATALAAGCGGSTIDPFPDVPSAGDARPDAPPDDVTAPPDTAPPDSAGRCQNNSDCRPSQFCAGMGCGTSGVCIDRPEACITLYDPVCGCDGRTYGNECEANNAGVRAARRGECGPVDAGTDAGVDVTVPPLGCRSNGDCRPTQFCAGMGCGTPGTCVERPGACTRVYDPVCGCDGRTYGNECEANNAGVRAARRGECGPVDAGVDIPGLDAVIDVIVPDAGVDVTVPPLGCRSNGDCRPTQFCAGMGCGTPGTCVERPSICPALYDPVCGCDGRTYSNECVANAAGVRVASRGECRPFVDAGVDIPGLDAVIDVIVPDSGASFCATVRCAAGTYCCESRRACIPVEEACSPTGACTNDSQCASGYLCCAGTGRCYNAACLSCCMVPPSSCASNSDCRSSQFCAGMGCGTRGTCQERPAACITLYDPVCGCDGRTYSNECVANAAGVRAARRGECGPVDAGTDAGVDVTVPPLGCRSNGDCRPTQFCAGMGCGTPGTCVERPGACTRVYDPVCGCDGRTYSNECEANAAGVRMASRGACGGAVDAGLDVSVDAGASRCSTSADCARGQECVFPETACAMTGTCQAAIACLLPNTYCSCDGATYQACRPDRPTRSTGACPSTSFCATVRCAAGTYCCESRRACIPMEEACTPTGTCTNDSQCASGYLCCAGTGRCYNAACLGCCTTTGTTCGSNSDCRSSQYCAGTGCGTRGTCVDRPEFCLEVYRPVCGCDGRTYSNDCYAARAGVRVASLGECGTTFCETVRCAAGTYCCESRRACIPMEEACSPTGACTSDSQCASGYLCCAGTGRCYPSTCRDCCRPVVSTCLNNSDCRATQYCGGEGCGRTGICVDRPAFCPDVYRPVCGCDGRTYSNDCYAAAAGVRVASSGPCS